MTRPACCDDGLRRILTQVRTIAMVGVSPNEARPSHGVMRYLLRKGYTILPINPGHAGRPILGTVFHADLKSVSVPIDMVDVFRASEALRSVVEEVLTLDPLPKVFWTQLGVRDDEAAARAEAAGIEVVMNRCPKIEYARLIGG